MIVKEISTQGRDENGQPLHLIRDSSNYPAGEWAQIMNYLKRNAAAGLLKYKVISK